MVVSSIKAVLASISSTPLVHLVWVERTACLLRQSNPKCLTTSQPTTSSSPCHHIHTSDQLNIQEQRDISSALAHSLEPVSHVSYQYPMNSYDSALGSMTSNTPSSSMSSVGPTQSLDTSSLSVSANQMPNASTFSSNMHFAPISSTGPTQLPSRPPASTTTPAVTETSGDRAAQQALDIQCTSNKLPIAGIVPQLSRQMHGAWLNQFKEHNASLMQVISDEAAQKALDLRCQQEFVLKFFRAVSRFKLD